jgi:Tfp pilus assembly protein PilN
MGLFWDLIQQSQISDQQSSTASLEDRVDRLEAQLHEVQQLQLTLLKTLEKHFGQDIDGDGHVG